MKKVRVLRWYVVDEWNNCYGPFGTKDEAMRKVEDDHDPYYSTMSFEEFLETHTIFPQVED